MALMTETFGMIGWMKYVGINFMAPDENVRTSSHPPIPNLKLEIRKEYNY